MGCKKIVRPIGKIIKKTLSKVNMTYSRGNNISGTLGVFALNFQIGMSVDTKGNFAIQYSVGGGVTGGSPSISCTGYQSISNAPSIHNLNGKGYQIGGSGGVSVYGVPLAFGGDFNIIPDDERNRHYLGVTGNLGIGTPGAEFHVEWGNTSTIEITEFNVFDMAENLYIKIMEW